MLHLPNLITDLTIILAAAAVITIIFKKLNQPIVLGYIIAGLLVSPKVSYFPSITDAKTITIWAEIGVIFLLFGLGLEFSFKKLKEVGGPASITGIVEVLSMLLVGYVGGQILGWSEMDSIFMGGILCISSTTIIIRAFEEAGVKSKKFASVVFGVLIVEDLVAILLLVLLSTIAVSQQFMGAELIQSSLKLVFFLIIWFLAGIFLLPGFFRILKKVLNDEMMLVVSIALCLLMVLFATQVGFSPALGAFIMGSLLAETSEGKRIEHIVQPVKDLFAAIFFVSVGMLIDPQVLVDNWPSILFITFLTIFGKIISSGLGALFSGQTLKNSVQIGFSLAQIGEFSFIIATLGVSLKVTSDFLYPMAVAVSVITTFTTPYLIKNSDNFAGWLERVLPKKMVESIYRYSSSTQAVSVSTVAREALRDFAIRLTVLVVIVVGVTVFGKNIIFDFILTEYSSSAIAAGSAFTITFLISAPFMWALTRGKINDSLSVFGTSRQYVYLPYALSFFRYMIVAIILSLQLYIFFSTIVGSVVFLAISVLAVTSFSKHLGGVYEWFEKTFVRNLYNNPMQEIIKDDYSILPWEAHLATYQISPDFPYLGQTLEGLSVREKYGVSIVLIQRGDRKIKAPARTEAIYPYDKISVIGTDEQFKNFKNFIEATVHPAPDSKSDDDYILHGHMLKADSPFVGKSIRSSGLREATEGLVVALERNSKRTVNPDSLEILQDEDLLWIVGNKDKLKKL